MRLLPTVLVGLLAQDVLALPGPKPKSSWVRKGGGRGKRQIHNVLRQRAEGRRDLNETATCAEALAAPIKAPKANVWGPMTDDEAAAVVAWLFAQGDLNLTVSDDAGAWDNSV